MKNYLLAMPRTRAVREQELDAPPASPPAKPRPAEAAIREGAYHRWQAAGSPPGDGVEFWLAAERAAKA